MFADRVRLVELGTKVAMEVVVEGAVKVWLGWWEACEENGIIT